MIQLKMLQRDGMVMVEMKVLVMEMIMMMIPMKSDAIMMTMAMISPLWEGIFPADFSLPKSFSLSGVLRPAEVAVSNSEPPSNLGFRGRRCTPKGGTRSGPGLPHTGLARPGSWPRHPGVWGPLAPLDSSFWLPESSGKI
jgi:hypothetical protein